MKQQRRIQKSGTARQRRSAQRGVTLVELVVVIGLTALIATAVTYAFIAGLDTERLQIQRRAQQDGVWRVEQQITQLLEGAKLGDSATDTSTYFQSDPNDAGSGGDLGTDRITFTTTALSVPMVAQNSADDFETQQQARGPIGGLAEVSLGTTPYGDAGDNTGLFERIQRPSDGDATQGGMEKLLSPQIAKIGFQFWDGTQWVTSWDTTQAPDSHRLPAAVQVRYVLQNDTSQTVHLLTVPILTSDVTPDNPITTTSSNTGGTGGTGQ